MTRDSTQSLIYLAAQISKALEAAQVSAVLSGGSVVTIYSNNEYQSHDLDFVTLASIKRITPVMEQMGFIRKSGRHFEHPDYAYFVEFPSGPLMLGNVLVQEWAQLEVESDVIQILTPTQSVMDRLAAFYHWNDRQCLDQALMVARHHNISLPEIKCWSEQEGHPQKYAEFQALYDSQGQDLS